MYIPHFIYPFICWWVLGLCISLLRQLEQNTQTGWLKQQKFVSSQFFRLKVLHHSLDWFSFWWGLSSQLAGDCFLPGSSYDLSCVCTHGREGAFSTSSSFLLLFSHSVVSDSLQPHGWQHARLPCPSVSLRVCSSHWGDDNIQLSRPLLDHKEGWAPKNWCFWTVVLEKTWESLRLQGDPTSPF